MAKKNRKKCESSTYWTLRFVWFREISKLWNSRSHSSFSIFFLLFSVWMFGWQTSWPSIDNVNRSANHLNVIKVDYVEYSRETVALPIWRVKPPPNKRRRRRSEQSTTLLRDAAFLTIFYISFLSTFELDSHCCTNKHGKRETENGGEKTRRIRSWPDFFCHFFFFFSFTRVTYIREVLNNA